MTEEVIVEDNSSEGEAVDKAQLEIMARAGVWHGRKKSKTNPRMKGYIFGTRNGIEIFDLPRTLERLEIAGEYLKSIMKEKGVILVIGTTPASKEIIRSLAEQFKLPFVTERWLGGTLTNFNTLKERIQYYVNLRKDRDMGRLEKYTKKERTDFDKKIERLTKLFGGLETLETLPKALLVIGANAHMIALREANRLRIPVVAIANSDANPDMVTHLIPANDNTRSSIAWIMEKLIPYIEEGKRESELIPKPEAKKEEKKEEKTAKS